MDLCEFCLDLVGWISSPHYADLPDTRYVDVCSGYKRRVFKKSMHITCQLCASLIDTMNLNAHQRTATLSLETSVWRSELRGAEGLYCFCSVGQYVNLALWANPGMKLYLACNKISTDMQMKVRRLLMSSSHSHLFAVGEWKR